MPNTKAIKGEISATVSPLGKPQSSAETASTALTQLPVTNCPAGLVTDCSTIKMAISRAVRTSHNVLFYMKITSNRHFT
jgi:hypothetical protein